MDVSTAFSFAKGSYFLCSKYMSNIATTATMQKPIGTPRMRSCRNKVPRKAMLATRSGFRQDTNIVWMYSGWLPTKITTLTRARVSDDISDFLVVLLILLLSFLQHSLCSADTATLS